MKPPLSMLPKAFTRFLAHCLKQLSVGHDSDIGFVLFNEQSSQVCPSLIFDISILVNQHKATPILLRGNV